MALGSDLVSLVTAFGVSLGLSAGSPDPTPATTGWAWPLSPRPAVVRAFDPPERPWEPGHRGVDLIATTGQPVVSPTTGRVTFAGMLAGRGVLVVTHANGLRSTFEPVNPAVATGADVERGELIGVIAGSGTHCDPAVCLHWGVLRGRDYVDPLALLGRPRIVLLPLG